jgi:hypothetical protein
MSKGDAGRPMEVPREQFEANYDRIMPTATKYCTGCGYSLAWCVCTKDGPKPDDEVKTHYERRRFERD